MKPEADHEGAAITTAGCWKHVGFQVIQLNGEDVSISTCEDLPRMMGNATDTISIVAVDNQHLRKMYMPYYGTTPVEEIVIPAGHSGFGLEFGGAKDEEHAADTRPGIFIAEVLPDYPASELAPRLVGKQVVMANGHDMTEGTLIGMMHVLSDVAGGELDHMVLRVTTNKALAAHVAGAGPVLTMVLGRAPGSTQSFGLEVGGPKNMAEGERYGFGVYVEGAKAGSLAAAQPTFGDYVGWQVVGMNGADCRHTTTTEFKAALKAVGNEIRLELQENRALKEVFTKKKERAALKKSTKTSKKSKKKSRALPEGTTAVTLTRGGTGFGLQFGGAKDEAEAESNGFGIYVSNTKPGGAAFDEESIVVGHQVLRLNDHDLYDATTEELQEHLKDLGDTMKLVLVENARLSNTYEQVNQSARRVLRASMWKDPMTGTLTGSGGPGGSGADNDGGSGSSLTAEEEAARLLELDNDDIIRTKVIKNEMGFGLRFGGPKSQEDGEAYGFGVFVSGTKPGGAAEDNSEICIGMQVLMLNGVDLTNATTATLSAALKTVKKEMTLHLIDNDALFKTYTQPAKLSGKRLGGRTRASIHHRKVKSNTASVRLEKGLGGFGLKFGGAASAEEAKRLGYGVFISGTKPGGAAEKVKELEIGMQVLSLNGTDLTKATTRELAGALRGVKGALVLDLETNEELYEAYNTKKRHISTTLKKGTEGFGMLFGGPKNKSVAEKHGYGVYVSSCKKGGAAAANPEIQDDLQIIAIQGINVSKGTLVDLAAALKKVGNELKLELAPNVKLAETYNALKTMKASKRSKKSKKKGGGGSSNSSSSGGGNSSSSGAEPITLTKGPAGFGLMFGGAKNQDEVSKMGYGVFVSGVKPGGAAEKHPGITIGHQITSIGGTDTTQATLKSLPAILKKISGSDMELVLHENVALFEKGTALRTAGKKKQDAEEPPPTSAAWYAGCIDTATCQAAVSELGVGAYLVNRTGSTTYTLIVSDEQADDGCCTRELIHTSGNFDQTVLKLSKSAKSDVTGRTLPVHTVAVELAQSSWWHPTKTKSSAASYIAKQSHGTFIVYPDGPGDFSVAVNDKGTALTIGITDLTVDLADSGCSSRGKFLAADSIHAAVSGLRHASAPIAGKSSLPLKFDTPAPGGSFHESSLEELVEDEESF